MHFRLTNNTRSLNATVMVGATEFRSGTRTVDSRFSSLHGKRKSIGVIGFTGGRGTTFGSSYREMYHSFLLEVKIRGGRSKSDLDGEGVHNR